MMGFSHALSGAAVWLAVTPALAAATPIGAKEVVVGAVATAGAALLPDLDHASSTAARSLGRGFARLVRHASGGHRQGTHSLLAVGVLGAFSWLAVLAGWSWVPVGLTVALGVAGLRLLRSARSGAVAVLGCLGAAWLAHRVGVGMSWAALAVVLGALAHLLGDLLTPEGVPLGWAPWHRRSRRYSLGLFTTNTWPERYVVVPMLIIGILLLGRVSLVG